MGKVGRDWESNGISVGWRGEDLDSSLGRLVFFFFGPNTKETDKPSLSSLAQHGGNGKGELQVETSTDRIPGTQTTASP